jgi:2-phospho-L-lactate guanylyltransferase
MALRPPNVIPFRYGPQSFSRHEAEAKRAGVPFATVRLDSLALDLDTPEDLKELLSRPPATATQRLLVRLGIAERLAAA